MYQPAGVGNMIFKVGNLPLARSLRGILTLVLVKSGCFNKSRSQLGTAKDPTKTGLLASAVMGPSAGALSKMTFVKAVVENTNEALESVTPDIGVQLLNVATTRTLVLLKLALICNVVPRMFAPPEIEAVRPGFAPTDV
jgi:hypothetical protein